MSKRILDLLVGYLIQVGQSLLELDSIGFDAICIGFIVLSLQQLRIKASRITDSSN